MRKLIAAINLTLDGFCDHDAITPDEEIHEHYTDLLKNADTILYGRITYQLMEYWPPIVKNPTGNKAMDEFAVVMDHIQKIVFSHTLKSVEWETAKLAKQSIEAEVAELKQQPGKDILVGSRSLMLQLMKLGLIDEYQFCLHPVIVGKGLPLFENISNKINIKLTKTENFGGGAVLLYYSPQG